MGIYNTPVLPVSRCAAGAAAIVPAASTTASTTVQCFFNLYDLSHFTISSPAPSVCSLRSSIVRVTNFKCNRISLLLSLSSSSSSVLLKSGSSPFFRSCCFRTSRNIEERLACKMNQVDGNFVSSNLESGNMIFEPILEEGVFRFDCTSNDRIAAFPSLSFVNPKARDTPIKSHKVPSYIPTFERVLGQQVYQIQLPFGTSFYGTGEVSGQLERTGKRVFTWNSDAWGYGPGTTSLYQSHPWVLAVLPNGEALGVLVDTTRRCEIDLRKQSTMKFVTPSSCPIITFGPFGSPTDVLVSLSHAVGTVFMPPKWSLGYHQCRWSYMSDKRVLEVARKFRERGIPCDVIWMDIDYMDGFRCFTFDHERFPDPKCLVKELQHNGIKAIWMLDPGIKQEKGYFVYDSGSESEVWIKTADGRPFVGDVWPGPCVFPDFTQSKARSWWANLVKDFVSNGVDGIWNDMNEPSVFKVVTKTMPESNVHFGDPDLGGFQNHSHYHNVYGMLMARSTYEGMKLANENKRPFVLTRAGFIGSQRYAATWTGDNLSTWEHLHMSISMVLQLGLSGQPLSGPDIGGFAGNATPKLFGRWMGIGAMFPFCRGHSEADTIDHEPWSFGEECEEVCRIALKRRYRLIPHLYTLFYMAHTKGTPVAAPIFFADSKDSSLRANESSFLLGPLLICASTMQNQGVHQIQHVLPKGIWLKFDFEDSHPDLPALYLQGGSILPLGPPHEHVGEANPEDDLTLLVAFDEHGKAEGVLFEDDGDGYKFTKGGYLLTYYVAELQSQVVTIKVTETKGSWKRPKRRLHVKLLLGEGAMIDSWGTDGELVQMMMPTEHEISKLVSISTENFKKRIGNQHSGIRTLHYSVRKMEDDGDGRRDVGWKYAFLGDPNNKNDVTCKFCQKVAKGGIYRLKQHLAGGYRNIKACNKCPEHIRQEIIEYMAKKKSERDQMNLLHEPDKITDLEEEETEFFMANDPRGKRPMSAVVSQASVAKKARQVGPMDAFCTPKVVALQSGKQSTINEAYRKEQREKAAADVARWLYDAGIPFNALNYPSFKVAMDSVARAGIGQKPLSAYEARVPFLRKEVQRTNDLMKIHREEWARTGCSIMSDGWEDRCHRSILNFLVNCSKGSMFIESVDASSYSKTGDRLYMLLSRIIEKVGEHNVVQVITDNGSNFVAAGALLEAKYPHLYWTPCAAHCIDLMLEDISKISAIDRVLKRAIHMTSFIYQRPNLINLMRRFSGQRNLLRPAKTRFATAFITLSSIHKQRDNLRKLFTSQEWVTSKWAKELGGKRASQTVLMPTFWNGLVYALKLTGPLVHTLRLVDGERKPAMGYIYEAMDRTKEIIASTFNGNESKYIDVFQIIDNRWECQLHRPLHAAGHFLNPEFFYNNPQLEQCEEVVSGLYQCIQRLVPIIAKQDKIMEELTAYKNADGLFGNPMAIRHRKTKAPAEWWAAYGSSTPTLQQFAVKILSLTCSSSGCERNWSIFEHMISLCETPGADFNNKAFACGHVIILITAELPNVMDIFLAKLNRACIYTVPKHVMYSKSAFETREAYFIAIGYNEESGKLESEDDFIQRLGSYMRLYGALIQTEIEGVQNLHGLEEGWSWLARAVNSLPPGVYTAVAIEAFLRMAGFALHRRYLSQFRKLLSVVARKFAEVFETREDHKSVFRGLKSYIETSEFLMEPEGWRLHGSLISRSLHI